MAFSITPVSGDVPAPESQAFPNFIQFQANGTDLGEPDADTLNILGGRATRGVGENANVITLDVAGMEWNDQAADYRLVLADAGHGIATTGTTGAQIITIPADTGDPDLDFVAGDTVLVYQEGAAVAQIAAESGVELRVRDALLPEAAGQYATITLIKRRDNEWLACGDLGAA